MKPPTKDDQPTKKRKYTRKTKKEDNITNRKITFILKPVPSTKTKDNLNKKKEDDPTIGIGNSGPREKVQKSVQPGLKVRERCTLSKSTSASP